MFRGKIDQKKNFFLIIIPATTLDHECLVCKPFFRKDLFHILQANMFVHVFYRHVAFMSCALFRTRFCAILRLNCEFL